MNEVVKYVLGLGLGTVTLSVILVVLWMGLAPNNAEKVGGWVALGASKLFGRFKKTATALRVQGDVNGLRANFIKDAPENLIEKKLKIEWTTAEGAEAIIRGGDVVVFMRDPGQHEENVANAIMAFLPKALIPRARRYLEPDTMRSVDLTVAKSLLAHDDAAEGTLEAFYTAHLDPARAGSDRLKAKLGQMDRVDMHGWLSRVLLAEYRRLGERLHPSDPDDQCLVEAERFADWLADVASRPPGTSGSLTFEGRYIRVAIVFVAMKDRLVAEGIHPYRKRTKKLLYSGRLDSVYLIARDANIEAVDAVVESIAGDAMIGSSTRHVHALRADFKARVLNRDKAICVCLRRRQGAAAEPDEISEETALPSESYEPPEVEADAAEQRQGDEPVSAA